MGAEVRKDLQSFEFNKISTLDRYRLELDSETEQVIYEGIMDALKRADLVELK